MNLSMMSLGGHVIRPSGVTVLLSWLLSKLPWFRVVSSQASLQTFPGTIIVNGSWLGIHQVLDARPRIYKCEIW